METDFPCCCCWPQVEDAINQTSQTLQLLIEHDPVPQRLDQLRLDARLSPHTQSTGHTLMLSTLDTKENQEGTLRRRSLRCCSVPCLSCSLSLPQRLGRLSEASSLREPAGQGQDRRHELTRLPRWDSQFTDGVSV